MNASTITLPCPWANVVTPEGYQLGAEGLHTVRDGGRAVDKLSGPVWLRAHTADDAGRFGVVVAWIDRFGELRERAFPCERLHDAGRTLTLLLARYGLAIVPGKERAIATYLGSFDALERWRAVTRAGWLDSTEGWLGYILAGSTELIGDPGAIPVVFQPEQRSLSEAAMRRGGKLSDWHRQVLEPCRANPGLLFAALVALSSLLLKPARLESGGFHYYGRSSRGKTTALQVTASVLGCGADPAECAEHAYIQRWNTTANALEALAATHNDSVLLLDELHSIDAKDLGRVVYNLMGGRGKAALTRDREYREPRVWRCLVLSTGELSVRGKIEHEGGRPFAGQLVRFLDIPIGRGIITEAGSNSPGDFAIALKRACSRYFGTLAPAFLNAIVNHYENAHALSACIVDRLDRYAEHYANRVREPELKRAARRFALAEVSGDLAAELGVLPIDNVEVRRAVEWAFGAWLTECGSLTDTARGLRALQAFIRSNPDRFEDTNPRGSAPYPVRRRAGFRVRLPRNGGDAYALFDEGIDEAIGGTDRSAVARALVRLGFLFQNDAPRHKARLDIPQLSGRPRLYTIRVEFLTWQGQDTPNIRDSKGGQFNRDNRDSRDSRESRDIALSIRVTKAT